jgi:hypothetical protein
MQIAEEMDLVLSKKNVCKMAARDWAVKWTPAILQLSKTLKGKQADLYKLNQQQCEGMCMCATHVHVY